MEDAEAPDAVTVGAELAASPEPVSVESVGDLSVVKSEDRGPDEIAREIEQTRAELADAIDAIADRISPKKAAARGVEAVKAQVTGRPEGATPGSSGPTNQAGKSAIPIAPLAAAVGLIVVIALFLRRRRSG